MIERLSTARTNGQPTDLPTAAGLDVATVLERLGTGEGGLTREQAARRLREVGPNVLRSHGARPLAVLLRQLKNYLLLLLLAAAAVSAFVGEGTDAVIIFVIIGLSVGLGFVNEYRSEKAVEELHARIRRRALVERDGVCNRWTSSSSSPATSSPSASETSSPPTSACSG